MHLPRTVRHLSALVAVFAIVTGPVVATAQPAPSGPSGAPAAGATPPAGDKPASGEDETLYSCKKARGAVTVSFKPETELKDLITWVMGFTCKNFIYDSSILSRSKKITIVSPLKMSPQEAYRVFLVSLSTMGLTVVPKGSVLRIVESSNAKSESVPVLRRGTPGNADEVVRVVMRPNYLSLNELSNAVNAVKSSVGAVQPVPEANALIITDWASHARDMVSLVRELDRPMPSSGVYTIKVQYADAKEMATKLSEILNMTGAAATNRSPGAPGAAPGAGAPTDIASAVPAKILADERTNTLLLLSNEAGYLRVRALVKRLDVAMDTEGADGSIHVYPLENATAEELAQTLNNALQGQASQQQNRRGQPGQNVPQAPRPAPVPGDIGAAFEGQVRVTHDAPTNSLVIVASGRDFVALSQVIRDLDISRRQVFIEAVILEVNLKSGLDVGSSFHGGVPVDGNEGAVVGGLQSSSLKSLNVASLASAAGLIGGLIGPELEGSKELLGTSIPSYAVLFQALATSTNSNLLSSPSIIASDNEESEISVGQTIPYIGGISTIGGFGLPGTGGTGGIGGIPQLNVQREKLNLTMKIKPHISGTERVRLDLELEIKDLGGDDPQLGPIWNERKIKTSVVVPDQESIAIGGLISDKVVYGEEKIPFLGDIPILGYLFKSTTKTKTKSNLLVLLTPYVVQDHLDINTIVERKVRERNEFVRSFGHLEDAKYLPKVDYRRKRGLIEEINRALVTIESEAAILRGYGGGVSGVPEGRLEYDELKNENDDEEPAPNAPAPNTPAPNAPNAPATTPTPDAAPASTPNAAPPAPSPTPKKVTARPAKKKAVAAKKPAAPAAAPAAGGR
jgi:general secretion pathway protein D